MSANQSGRWMRMARLALAAALWAVGAEGCKGSDPNDVSASGPVLLRMYWTGRHDSDGRAVIWSVNADADLKTVVTAAPFEFELIFDRRLDGDKIEDTVVQGGITYTIPKLMPPVTVTWDGMPDNLGPLTVAYNSLNLGGTPTGTTYVFGRADLGYPSSTALTFHLDRETLVGSDKRPFVGPDTIAVTTAPFTMQIRRPGVADAAAVPVVPGDFQFPLAFSSQPGRAADVQPFVSLLVDGDAAPFRLTTTDQDPTLLYVSPPALGQQWPAGAHIALSVKPGLPDVFGAPLGDGADAEFDIAGMRPATDAGGADGSD